VKLTAKNAPRVDSDGSARRSTKWCKTNLVYFPSSSSC